MACKGFPGYEGFIFTSRDGGDNFTKLAAVRDMTITFEADNFDSTSHDDGGFTCTSPGLKSWSFSAECIFVDGDPAQDDLFDAWLENVTLQVQWFPKIATGVKYYQGEFVIDSLEINAPNDDIESLSGEFTGNGKPERILQEAA